MKFCRYCGAQLADAAVWCPSCQRSLIPNYTVTIVREKQIYIGKLVYKLDVDGKEHYAIDNGETLTLTLPAGQHTLYFHQSFRSKTLTVDLQRDVCLRLSWDRISGGISLYETAGVNTQTNDLTGSVDNNKQDTTQETAAPQNQAAAADADVQANAKSATADVIQAHTWRCPRCGKMRTQSPCEHCGDDGVASQEEAEKLSIAAGAQERGAPQEQANAITKQSEEKGVTKQKDTKTIIILCVLVGLCVIGVIIGIVLSGRSQSKREAIADTTTSATDIETKTSQKTTAAQTTTENNDSLSSTNLYPTKEEYLQSLKKAYEALGANANVILGSETLVDGGPSFKVTVYLGSISCCEATALIDVSGKDKGHVTGVICYNTSEYYNYCAQAGATPQEASLSVVPALLALSGNQYYSTSTIESYINGLFQSTPQSKSGWSMFEKSYSGYSIELLISSSYKIVSAAGSGGIESLSALGY